MALAVLLAVPIAWTLSNLVDSSPEPRPPALRLSPAAVPPVRNAFFDLVGLRGPGSADPRRHGRQRWANGAWATEAAGIAVPSGAPFECGKDGNECAADWLGHADELKSQLARYAELARRCTALSQGMEFEEVLPDEGDARWIAGAVAPHASNAALCNRWLLAQASLATARSDRRAAAAWLQAADRFDRSLLEGSRSLISHAVGWALQRRTWNAASTMVAADAALAQSMGELELPLPLSVREASHWMAAEAAYQRAVVDSIRAGCDEPGVAPAAIARFLCRTGIGVLPNVTKADIDHYWLQALNATRDGPASALDRPPFAPRREWHDLLAWRNTFGRLLVGIGADNYSQYLARQADLVLCHQVFVLAMAMAREHVAPQDRAAWLMARPLDPALRARLHVENDQLVGDDWSAAYGARQARFRIRMELPRM